MLPSKKTLTTGQGPLDSLHRRSEGLLPEAIDEEPTSPKNSQHQKICTQVLKKVMKLPLPPSIWQLPLHM